MKINAKYLIFVAMFPLFSACTPSPAPSKTSAQADTTSNNPATYTPDVESLSRHQAAPEWFRDAKFGIYFAWGPYTVAEHINEWYPRWMHFGLKESDWNGKRRGYLIDALDWHSERFGHPSEFGDHNMVPLFTAEHFDAEEWGKDVILTHKHEDTPASFSVLDLEKGRQAALSSDPWLTDDTISKGSWSYTKDHQIKSDIDVTHALIDLHGFGSGRLRQAVRQHLGSHPAVTQFRPGRKNEGGDGATVVTLNKS